MNARFQFIFIRHLNQQRHQGFAVIMAIMMGMIMLVLGGTVIIRSQGDQSKVVAATQSSKASAIAEAGITRWMDFLNSNRSLLTYPDCNGDRTANGACPDTGTSTKSWSLAANLFPPPAGASCNNPVSTDIPTTAEIQAIQSLANADGSHGWQTANGDGQYKLVAYKYTPDGAPYTAPGTSVLAVQGKVGSANNSSEGKTQLLVKFRISGIKGNPLIPQFNPGLWARNFNTSSTVYGNVLDSSGCTGGTPFSGTSGNLPSSPLGALPNGNSTPPLSSTPGTITSQNLAFPPLPTYPAATDPDTTTITTDNFPDLVAAHKVNSLSDCSRSQYPQTGDYDSEGNLYSSTSTTPKTYKYRITGNCAPPSGVSFGTAGKGNELIVMYVDSTLNLSNNGILASSGGSNTKVHWLLKTAGLNLGGNSQVGSANPTANTAKNWTFFVYSGTNISLQGTADYYAFIFAPYASVNMAGNPKIAGSLWVNSFSTNGSPPKMFQATTQTDINEIFTDAYTASGDTALLPPQTMGTVISYQKTEVDTPVPAP